MEFREAGRWTANVSLPEKETVSTFVPHQLTRLRLNRFSLRFLLLLLPLVRAAVACSSPRVHQKAPDFLLVFSAWPLGLLWSRHNLLKLRPRHSCTSLLAWPHLVVGCRTASDEEAGGKLLLAAGRGFSLSFLSLFQLKQS